METQITNRQRLAAEHAESLLSRSDNGPRYEDEIGEAYIDEDVEDRDDEQSEDSELEAAEDSEAEEEVAANDEGVEDVPRKIRVRIADKDEDVDETELVSAYQKYKEHTSSIAAIEQNRSALDIEMKLFSELREDVTALSTLDAQIAQYDSIDWNALAEEDTTSYLSYERKLRELERKRTVLANELSGKHEKLVTSERDRVKREYDEADKVMAKEVTGWSSGGRDGLIKYLGEQGFSDMDWSGIRSASMAKVLWKAKLYDEGKAALHTKKAAAPAPKVMKPGSDREAQGKAYLEAKQRLAQSGRLEDAVAFLNVSKRR